MTFFHEIINDTERYAEPLLERAVDLDPYNPVIRNNYATYLNVSGRPREALEHYEMALSVSPGWADLRNTYAVTLDELGEQYRAKKEYEKVIESEQPQPQAHANLGILMTELENFGQATHHFEEAITKGYHDPGIYTNLGIHYADSGDYLKAVEILKEGLELLDSGRKDQQLIEPPEELVNNPLYEGVQEEWRSPESKLRVSLGIVYDDIERYDKTVEVLEPLLKQDSVSAEVHGLLSIAYSHLGDREQAIRQAKLSREAECGQEFLEDDYLDKLEIEDVRDSDSWKEKPDLLRVMDQNLYENKYSKAWENGQDLIEMGFDTAEVRRRLGDVAEELGYNDQAEHHFETAIEYDPDDGRAHHHYGNFLKHQQRFTEARERFEAGIQVSNAPEIHVDYGLLLVEIGQPEKAAEILSQSLERIEDTSSTHLDKSQIHHNYAQALFHADKLELAREQYNEAIELDEEYAEPRFGLGQLETDVGNISEGIDRLEDAMRLFAKEGQLDKWEKALLLAIWTLRDADRTEEVIEKCDYGLEMLQDIGAGNSPEALALAKLKEDLQDNRTPSNTTDNV